MSPPINNYHHWKVWKAIKALEERTSSIFKVNEKNEAESKHNSDNDSNNDSNRQCSTRYDELADETSQVLREWGSQWAGANEWQSFLNKSSLLHEVEESLVSIQALIDWLQAGNASKDVEDVKTNGGGVAVPSNDPDITVLDICCGKGVFSMLLTFLAARPLFQSKLQRIKYCIMIDKANISWNHIRYANSMYNKDVEDISSPSSEALNVSSSTPTDSSQNRKQTNDKRVAFPIEIWENCNIHDESFYHKLQNHVIPKSSSSLPSNNNDGKNKIKNNANQQLAMVGIHLCKTLSPRCISIFNMLGNKRAPFLCLAPCCLPRISSKPNAFLPVSCYPTQKELKSFEKLMKLRNNAISRKRKSNSSSNNNTNEIDSNNNDDSSKANSTITPCWKCGQMGHYKATCTTVLKDQNGDIVLSSRPPKPKQRVMKVNLDMVKKSKNPFDTYCALLAETVQKEATEKGAVALLASVGTKQDAPVMDYRKPAKSSLIMEVHLTGNVDSRHRCGFPSDANTLTNENTIRGDNGISKNWNGGRKSTWIICER